MRMRLAVKLDPEEVEQLFELEPGCKITTPYCFPDYAGKPATVVAVDGSDVTIKVEECGTLLSGNKGNF